MPAVLKAKKGSRKYFIVRLSQIEDQMNPLDAPMFGTAVAWGAEGRLDREPRTLRIDSQRSGTDFNNPMVETNQAG